MAAQALPQEEERGNQGNLFAVVLTASHAEVCNAECG